MNLVCCISPDHVLDCFLTTWVVEHPGINLEDLIVNDYDHSALGNQGLHLSSSDCRIFPAIWFVHEVQLASESLSQCREVSSNRNSCRTLEKGPE